MKGLKFKSEKKWRRMKLPRTGEVRSSRKRKATKNLKIIGKPSLRTDMKYARTEAQRIWESFDVKQMCTCTFLPWMNWRNPLIPYPLFIDPKSRWSLPFARLDLSDFSVFFQKVGSGCDSTLKEEVLLEALSLKDVIHQKREEVARLKGFGMK